MDYTKGEWEIINIKFDGSRRYEIEGDFPDGKIAGGKRVAIVWELTDAQLIAAAPEMYEALKRINRAYDKSCEIVELYEPMEQVLKALAKAEGK